MTAPPHNLRDERVQAVVEDFAREHGPDVHMSRDEFEFAYTMLYPSEMMARDGRSKVLHAFHVKYKDTHGKSNNQKAHERRGKPRPRRSEACVERRQRNKEARAAVDARAAAAEANAPAAPHGAPADARAAAAEATQDAPAASSGDAFTSPTGARRWLETIREDPITSARDDLEPAFVRVSRLCQGGLGSEVVGAPHFRDEWKARGFDIAAIARARSRQWDDADALGWPYDVGGPYDVGHTGRALAAARAHADFARSALNSTVRGRARSAEPMSVPFESGVRRRRSGSTAPPPTPTADDAARNEWSRTLKQLPERPWPPTPKRLPDAA